MTDSPARRPWWKKMRWAAVSLLPLLVAAYPAGVSPLVYAVRRGWVAEHVYGTVAAPAWAASEATPATADAYTNT